MTREFQRGNVAVRSDDKVEVKVGSGSVIVEQSELHNLIEALSELRSLIANSRPSDCGDKPEPDFVPTRDEVEQSRKLVEEVRRSSTRDGESQPRQRDAKVARAPKGL